MNYSIGILTYNQEQFILETLESIKYQVENFGKAIDVYLIFSDDCSLDRTVVVAKKWIDDNKNLFKGIQIKEHKKNIGTVLNYCDILSSINTNNFKIIAGDDLLSRNNIFDNNEHKIVANIPLVLKNGKIEKNNEFINKYLFFSNKKRNNSFDINRMIIGSYVNTPSVFVDKNLINEYCINFMKEFIIFEDDPLWYSILSKNKDITIEFSAEIKTIYRIHDASVSNSFLINKIFVKDYIKLLKYYLKICKNKFIRIYVMFNLIKNIKLLKINKRSKVSLYYILNKFDYLLIVLKALRYKTKIFNDYINSQLIENQEYYNRIKTEADKKYKEYIID